MCGRFTLKTPVPQWIANLFPGFADRVSEMTVPLKGHGAALTAPRYNIAPTQEILVVPQFSAGGLPHVEAMRWGLVPHWADSLKDGYTMINARSETLNEKPTFKQAIPKHRCVVVADGYYEWQRPPIGAPKDAKKHPFWIHRPDDQILAMAGLWAENKRVNKEHAIRSATIITTGANLDTESVHDRMPVLLRSEKEIQMWLDLDFDDRDTLLAMLQSAPEGTLVTREVSTRVNSPRDDAPELIEPVS